LLGSTFVGNDLIIVFTTGTTRIIDDVNHPIERTITSDGVTVVMATGNTGGNAGGILSGTDGNDVLDGRGGDDWLYGDGGNDRLIGGTGNDHLFGGAGNDVLDGGEGDDVLNGGPGNNRLIGGAGNDMFVVTPVTTSPGGSDKFDFTGLAGFKAEANHTTIEDFVSGQDHIDLTAFHTSFDALIGDHGGHPGHGDDAGVLSLVTEGHDSVLTFEGGTVRIVDVAHMHATDFLF
jgi:Ca2+-binding RTX toxin-like protein